MTARAERLPAGHYGFRHVARMEWIKLRSLRSTWWTLGITVAATAGIGVQAGTSAKNSASADNLVSNTLVGALLGILLVSVLGVLVMTGEYSSGMIRPTLAAAPRRPLLLAAKAAVFGAVALIVGEVASFASFFASAMAVGHGIPALALSQPGVLRAVVLTGASYCLIGLLGLGAGAIIRNTAAGIVVLVVGVYVVAQLGGKIVNMARYAPIQIVQDSLGRIQQPACIGNGGPCPHLLSPWAGLGMLCLYAAVALIIGGWLLARRDA
jgi:ABC-2 type transport system permease protein